MPLPSLCCGCRSCWDLVADSVVRCVWSPDGVDLIDMLLFCSEKQDPAKRVTFLRQYSRALNTAFGKVSACWLYRYCSGRLWGVREVVARSAWEQTGVLRHGAGLQAGPAMGLLWNLPCCRIPTVATFGRC